jgi:5'(3')-deoxyribonucleotidase
MYKIYCDMDGVIVDFVKGYKELTGVDTKHYVNSTPQFWQPVDEQGPAFWASLDWTSDGRQLWDYIKKHKPSILSSPSRSQTSRVGKQAWVKTYIPRTQYKDLLLYPRHEKQLFAGENRILIDDLAKTIDEWNAKGGIGILHTSTASTIKQLKELGL